MVPLLLLLLTYASAFQPSGTIYRQQQHQKLHQRLQQQRHDDVQHQHVNTFTPKTLAKAVVTAALTWMVATGSGSFTAGADEGSNSPQTEIITRADVGLINLNEEEPKVSDVCWLDFQLGGSDIKRVEISLYGTVVPDTVTNFKTLCKEGRYGGSEIFRIISEFSVQGGNIGFSEDTPASRRGRFGVSASGQVFQPENFRILHNYKDAGVVSMMKDVQHGGGQDSRFFITLKDDASWADGKYTAFGRVSKGMDFISSLIVIPVDPPANYPQTKVSIVGSGVY
jgi:cyclophilin family peptidyl-prolyl cis-trans isomerase